MGLCCSKNHPIPSSPAKIPKPYEPPQPVDAPVSENKQNIAPLTTVEDKVNERPATPPTPSKSDKCGSAEETSSGSNCSNREDFKPPAVVRSSSCTKEEVDAILIQCGRLSRSTSGGNNCRRFAGSKRSYDFDSESKRGESGEESGDKPVSKPSPQRRTRDRSGSRERDGGSSGGRRVSRSPGRRSELTTASERSRQPTRMVSVPAREKTRGVSPVGSGNKRCASPRPRSRSPANSCRVLSENAGQGQPITRSSSRKAEHSPYRRSPMAEIDENVVKGNSNGCNNLKAKGKHGDETLRQANQIENQRTREQKVAAAVNTEVKVNHVFISSAREQLVSCRANESEKMVESNDDSHKSRTVSQTMSSRRSSRDFDNVVNPSYTSLLLEDIKNYHQQHQNLGITLPACVSKACSIVEAVADLNSASSENKSSEAEKTSGRRGLARGEPFVESEIGAKGADLLEPSLQRYVTVRGETEPQESAGSNSFVGQAWSCSMEPHSVNSTDRYWPSKYVNGDEAEHEAEITPRVRNYQDCESETRSRISRTVAQSNNNSLLTQATPSTTKRSEMYDSRSQPNRAGSGVSGGSARVAGRTNSLAVASS